MNVGKEAAPESSVGQRRAGDTRLLTVLCLSSSLAIVNAVILAPFLSDIADEFGTSVALLGQAVTATSLFGATMGLILGPLSERIGYRRLMLIGISAQIVSNLSTAIAPSFFPLLVAQLIGGFGSSVMSPMAQAIAGARFGPARRTWAISRIYTASSGAMIIGSPLLTTIGEQWSWRWSYVTLSFMTMTLLALAFVVLPATVSAQAASVHVRTMFRAYGPLLRHRPVALLLGGQFLRGIAWTGTMSYFGAFVIEQLGGSLRAAGLASTMTGSGFLLGSLLIGGRLRNREPRVAFMLAVTAMGALIGVIFLVQPPLPAAFALLFLVAFSCGIAEVVAATTLSGETPVAQGTTMAFHSATLRYGTGMGALVGGGLLATAGYSALGVGFPLIALTAALSVWLSWRTPVPETASLDVVRE